MRNKGNPSRVATTKHRSELTADQSNNVRAKLMSLATRVVAQLGRYVDGEEIGSNGRKLVVDATRLAAYRMILERTVPTLAASTVEHKGVLESMSSEQVLARLAALAEDRPELKARLLEVLRPKALEAQRVE